MLSIGIVYHTYPYVCAQKFIFEVSVLLDIMAFIRNALVILLFFIHYIKGYKNVITVKEGGKNHWLSCSCSRSYACHSFLEVLQNLTNDTLINITTDVVLSGLKQVKNLHGIAIVGNNATINCNNSGGLAFQLCNNITIENLNWENCGQKKSRRGRVNGMPVLEMHKSSNITIQNCRLQNSINRALVLKNVSGIVNIIGCIFKHNKHVISQNGIAIHHLSENRTNRLTISGCDFIDNYNGASVIYFQRAIHELSINLSIKNCNFTGNKAIPIKVVGKQVLITGNLLFKNNSAAGNGGSMAITESRINFTNCNLFFENNNAKNGGAIFSVDSKITFEGNSTITLNNNSGIQKGGGMYLSNSTVIFETLADATFRNNKGDDGGALYAIKESNVTFEGSSILMFSNNSAGAGGALYFSTASHITFKSYSNISFHFNQAQFGAGSWCSKGSITFAGNSKVTFADNIGLLKEKLGAVGFNNCTVKFTGNTTVLLKNNTRVYVGAVFCNGTSSITFAQNSRVTFAENRARRGCGLKCVQSNIMFTGNTAVSFTSNKAHQDGGAIHIKGTYLTVTENATLNFINNTAKVGGSVYNINSTVTFNDNSLIAFTNNTANTGGAMYMSLLHYVLGGNCNVIFENNKADMGGAIYFKNSNVTVMGYTKLAYINNSATSGGAMHVAEITVISFEKYASINFTSNAAKTFGGAMHISESNLTIASKSVVFANNSALQDGGALYFTTKFYFECKNNSKLLFRKNSAEDHGSAAYCELDENSFINLNATNVVYEENTARFGGALMFAKVPKLWDTNALQNNIKGINKNSRSKVLITSPYKLMLRSPIDDINGVDSYYIQNIMPGQEIMIDACVLDYFNQTGNVVPFLISIDSCTGDINGCQDYYLDGQNMISILCTKFQSISLNGKKISPYTTKNYSLALTSHFSRDSEWKRLMVKLTIELVPCHPGFWHNNEKCECFSAGDVISCSGSTSIIKRGYWFGFVNGKQTVTTCPYRYCNFSCCQTNTGFNNLSPQRSNQCRSHRSGTACGSCEDGYTLSFDSIECVDVEKCTTGQTVLVTVLTVIYWITVVVVVFIIMYYQVGIHYLYGITYYYSMIDILFLPSVSTSQSLHTAISVMSSFAKIIPQFIGQLCLTDGLIGIDQQFIHYIHPIAVSFLLVMICLVARCSMTFSAFISKGIIQALCLLLLLSYTSIATTSLLLIRPLTFHDVDKIYTYLSPELEYFHGRHLLYAIVSIIFIIVIVIGLPLLLLLEPFLNRRINFIRIKPLLDQFQGCYKDKYRSFSAYYMICRQVLIVIVIVISSDDFTSRYLLVAACTFIALIHLVIRPYNNNLLNNLDGIILQLMILVVGLSPVDNLNSQISVAMSAILLATPLSIFIAMKLLIHQKSIKQKVLHSKFRRVKHQNEKKMVSTSKGDINIIIDDNMRRNATICDMYVRLYVLM